jgi:hypothetical protein
MDTNEKGMSTEELQAYADSIRAELQPGIDSGELTQEQVDEFLKDIETLPMVVYLGLKELGDI